MRYISLFLLLLIFSFGCETAPDDITIILEDKNNYSYEIHCSIPHIETACGEYAPDVVVDWTDLTVDMWGNEIDPATDVDNFWLLFFLPGVTEQEAEEIFVTGELFPETLDAYLTADNMANETSLMFSDIDMVCGGFGIDSAYVDDAHLFMLTLNEPITSSRAAVFLEPSDESENTLVKIDDASNTVNYEVDLSTLEPVHIPDGGGQRIMDWSGLTLDSQGNELDFESIDLLRLMYFESETIESIEGKILKPTLEATNLFERNVAALSSFDLTELDGFGGLEGDGVWIFALYDSWDIVPAPLFMTVLD